MISEGPSSRPARRGGRTVTVVAPLVPIALAAALVGGCLARAAPPAGQAHHAPASSTLVAQPGTSGQLNPTDLAWLQLMIPMDERVLPLLDLGAAQGHSLAIRRLARQLRDAHVAELTRLRETLRLSGLPADNPHTGHDMPGMIIAAELTRLRAAEGAAFDALFTGHLDAHLRQSLSVTRSEQISGADPGVKALAAAIERTRTTQLSALPPVEPSPPWTRKPPS
jgi:uncharacterized protein (DUF305 family)